MTVEEKVRLDSKKLNSISKDISISMARRTIYDYSFLKSLISTLGIKDLSVDVDFLALDDGEHIIYTIEDYLEELEKIATRVLKMYRKMDFYCYCYNGYESLSAKDRIDILYGFMDEFLPELLSMYKKMYSEDKIFLGDLGDNLGESYCLPNIDSYYVALNINQKSDINNLETIIHEMLHVYAMRFLRNYDWHKTQSLLNRLSSETIPLYGELAFSDYLVRNNVLKESTYFHRNNLDYDLLEFFKIIKFFCCLARKDKDNFHFPGGLSYEYKGELACPLYQGVPFMEFRRELLKKGELINFAYGIGSIEAYRLLQLERRGASPKEIIDNFLVEQGEPDHLEKSVFNADLSFMSQEIKKRQLILENIRPIPGFRQ